MGKNSKLLKILLTVVLLGIVSVIFRYFPPGYVQNLILSTGEYGVIVYILCWIILPFGFFPVAVLAITGGIGFGIKGGMIFTFLGASINLLLMFLVGRYLARDVVQRFIKKRYPNLERFMTNQEHLNYSLMLIRLLPFPYDMINYAYGITDISIWSYYWISLITILPGMFIYVNIGDKTLSIGSPEFIFSILLFVPLFVVTGILNKKYYEKMKDENI